MATKIKMYLLPDSTSSDSSLFTVIEKQVYLKRPMKVFVDSRPAMLKFKQEIEYKDPKDIGAKPKQLVIEGYFKRFGVDDYRQMTQLEIKKVLGWMLKNNVKPQDLTLAQMETALSSVLELVDKESSIVVPGQEGEKRTKGGLVIPGS